MAKTRMNSAHREVLRDFAHKKVEESINRKSEITAYAKILAETNTLLRKKYPEKDMEVLRKYKLECQYTSFRYSLPSGRVDGFTFEKELGWPCDTPKQNNWSDTAVLVVSAAFEKAFDEHNKAKHANDELLTQKKRDCNTLINFAKYVEDVLEVIKVPKEIEAKLVAKSTALVALSPDVLARIQKDFSS